MPKSKRTIINEYQNTIPVDVIGLAKTLGINILIQRIPLTIKGYIGAHKNQYSITLDKDNTEELNKDIVARSLYYYFHKKKILKDKSVVRFFGLCSVKSNATALEQKAYSYSLDLLIPNKIFSKNINLKRIMSNMKRVNRKPTPLTFFKKIFFNDISTEEDIRALYDYLIMTKEAKRLASYFGVSEINIFAKAVKQVVHLKY